MRTTTIIAIATMLATGSAFGQSTETTTVAGASAKPAATAPAAHAIKPAAASTPESRSAAALALSHEPTLDEGTAQRIKEAALSYSDLAVRGGWPTIPADAKFVSGVAGPNDDLLRKRLIVTGDLAEDKATGPFDETVIEGVMRFQARHGLAPTGVVTPRTLAALNVPVQKRIKQLEASLERLDNMSPLPSQMAVAGRSIDFGPWRRKISLIETQLSKINICGNLLRTGCYRLDRLD